MGLLLALAIFRIGKTMVSSFCGADLIEIAHIVQSTTVATAISGWRKAVDHQHHGEIWCGLCMAVPLASAMPPVSATQITKQLGRRRNL